jgi:hypothetical protein
MASRNKRALGRSEVAREASANEDFVARLTELLPDAERLSNQKEIDAHEDFLSYLGANDHRIDYPSFQGRGLQISSGAMESLHRIGSQQRLKRSGITCLPETAQALFDWRMLKLVGRWDEFWRQPNIGTKIAETWNDQVLEYELKDAA